MTSNIQPSTPLGDDILPPFYESTVNFEDQDNDLKNNYPSNFFESEMESDSPFTIETNFSGGNDQDSHIFVEEGPTRTKDYINLEAQSPVLVEVPSNADFFNLKSSFEYTIEEDQQQQSPEVLSYQEEKKPKEVNHHDQQPSDTAPFTDATESSFMAGMSNLYETDQTPPTRLKFSVEGCYSSSSITDPQYSSYAPSISIMEGDDNPNSLTSPQEFSSISSSSYSNASSSFIVPPSKFVKTEHKTSASQKVVYLNEDDLSGYTSDVSEEGEETKPVLKVPYFEVRITLSQYNFFRIVRMPQNVNLNDMYIIAMEALDWDDDKYKERPHYFKDEAGRAFANSARTVSNIPIAEKEIIRDERAYRLNQILKHERGVLMLYYFSVKQWSISIALQEIFDEKPIQDSAYTQEIYCTSGRGGSISEEDKSKNGKFNKPHVNMRLQGLKLTYSQ